MAELRVLARIVLFTPWIPKVMESSVSTYTTFDAPAMADSSECPATEPLTKRRKIESEEVREENSDIMNKAFTESDGEEAAHEEDIGDCIDCEEPGRAEPAWKMLGLDGVELPRNAALCDAVAFVRVQSTIAGPNPTTELSQKERFHRCFDPVETILPEVYARGKHLLMKCVGFGLSARPVPVIVDYNNPESQAVSIWVSYNDLGVLVTRVSYANKRPEHTAQHAVFFFDHPEFALAVCSLLAIRQVSQISYRAEELVHILECVRRLELVLPPTMSEKEFDDFKTLVGYVHEWEQ